MIPEKNIARLLQAYYQYQNARRVEPLGACSGRIWARGVLAQENGHSKQYRGCSFYGLLQIDELPQYYARAGCFVLPSTSEPWGLVVNEAMASGIPVLVSNRCGCGPDLVHEGQNGFAFDPLNARLSLTCCSGFHTAICL